MTYKKNLCLGIFVLSACHRLPNLHIRHNAKCTEESLKEITQHSPQEIKDWAQRNKELLFNLTNGQIKNIIHNVDLNKLDEILCNIFSLSTIQEANREILICRLKKIKADFRKRVTEENKKDSEPTLEEQIKKIIRTYISPDEDNWLEDLNNIVNDLAIQLSEKITSIDYSFHPNVQKVITQINECLELLEKMTKYKDKDEFEQNNEKDSDDLKKKIDTIDAAYVDTFIKMTKEKFIEGVKDWKPFEEFIKNCNSGSLEKEIKVLRERQYICQEDLNEIIRRLNIALIIRGQAFCDFETWEEKLNLKVHIDEKGQIILKSPHYEYYFSPEDSGVRTKKIFLGQPLFVETVIDDNALIKLIQCISTNNLLNDKYELNVVTSPYDDTNISPIEIKTSSEHPDRIDMEIIKIISDGYMSAFYNFVKAKSIALIPKN